MESDEAGDARGCGGKAKASEPIQTLSSLFFVASGEVRVEVYGDQYGGCMILTTSKRCSGARLQ